MVGFIVIIAAGVLWAFGLPVDKCMIVFYVGAGLTALHLICDSFDVWATRNTEKGG